MKKNSKKLMLWLNNIAVLILYVMLLAAYAVQFSLHDLPCPLCLLQRIGLMLTMVGFLMNIRFGIRSSHYAIIILSLLFTAVASGRQILLHITTPDSGYGPIILGYHMYTWVFIVAVIGLVIIALVLLVNKQFSSNETIEILSVVQKSLFFLVLIIVAGNIITTFIECGPLICPNNPICTDHDRRGCIMSYLLK